MTNARQCEVAFCICLWHDGKQGNSIFMMIEDAIRLLLGEHEVGFYQKRGGML